MIVHAPAKINLALDVLGKDSSGYHEIQTIMHEVPELYDEVEIIESEKPGAHPAQLLLAQPNFQIKITQNIPRGSGLGGESSCNAAILKAINKLANLGLSDEELRDIAAQLGMDTPFFISGGTALCTHFGEQIQQLPTFNITAKITALQSPTPDKTTSAYAALDLTQCGHNTALTQKMLEAFDPALIHNDFETLTPTDDHLCGSGPSTFKIQPAP